MGSFRDLPFEQRFAKLGDEAETIFTEVYPQGFVKFGLDRPPISLHTVPAFVRFTPDFLTSKGMVEVQGFGRDQTFKLKDAKWDALEEWHRFFRVDFFVWDSTNRRYGWIRLPELAHVLPLADVRFFPEGHRYFAWRAVDVPVIEWIEYGKALGAKR